MTQYTEVEVQTQDILHELSYHLEDDLAQDEHEMFSSDIEDRLNKGWLRSEIISYMLNVENFNPTLDEDIALANMARITETVSKRLSQ